MQNRRLVNCGLVVCSILAYLFSLASLAVGAERVSSLLSRFEAERDTATKEAILTEILRDHPDAGPQLLQTAKSTNDVDTRWLAIRGLGELKFEPATKFLLTCLNNAHPYVRANAARALGDINASSAASELINLLRNDEDDGVIQQTALALEMIKAKQAIPTLRNRAENVNNSQTECWLIGAIAVLGSRNDVAFVAKRLYSDDLVIANCAAGALQQLTGEDLHLGMHPGPNNPSEPVSKARAWWEKHAGNWD